MERKQKLMLIRAGQLVNLEGADYFFTGRGEAAEGDPYSAFNICDYTGDTPEHVAACRQRLASHLGIEPEAIIVPRQVHGATVAHIDAPGWRGEADAVITGREGICLTVSTADCVPILLYDPVHRAIGAVHAGWRGLVAHIIPRAVEAMTEAFGSHPADLYGITGPAISPEVYEVGSEVADEFRRAGFREAVVKPSDKEGKAYVDLWQSALDELHAAGLQPEHTDTVGLCTYLSPALLSSARRLGIASGRISGCIILK